MNKFQLHYPTYMTQLNTTSERSAKSQQGNEGSSLQFQKSFELKSSDPESYPFMSRSDSTLSTPQHYESSLDWKICARSLYLIVPAPNEVWIFQICPNIQIRCNFRFNTCNINDTIWWHMNRSVFIALHINTCKSQGIGDSAKTVSGYDSFCFTIWRL